MTAYELFMVLIGIVGISLKISEHINNKKAQKK